MIFMQKNTKKDPIQDFLRNYHNERTKIVYESNIKNFFKVMKKDPVTYFKPSRDYKKDVEKYYRWLVTKSGYAPLVIHHKLTCLRQFLEENDIDFGSKYWKKLKRRTKISRKAITMDKVPKNNELKQILTHGNTMEKAFILIQSSSGLRISEMLNIEIGDIDFDFDPPLVNVRSEIAKNHTQRYTFISYEAKDSLNEYLKVRDDFLRNAVKRCTSRNKIGTLCKKSMSDTRLFPYTQSTIGKKWHRLLRDSKMDKRDKNTNIHIFHDHTLRKFFETRMSNAGVPEAIYQALEGHEGYLNGAYKRYSIDELGDWYKKAMSSLSIFESTPDLTEVHDKLREKDKQIQKQDQQIENMMKEIELMKNKIHLLEMEKRVNNLEKKNGIK